MKKQLFLSLFVLILASIAQAQNPAVCRVRVPEGDSICSYGTGTCVSCSKEHNLSLIITAHHVIEDHKGKSITVIFPSTTRKAKVIGFDEHYDLAALVVKGKLPVLKIAKKKPIRGQTITLIGYASGEYREASGKVNGFYRPNEGLPAHWFSVDHPSRSGDSGGPMLSKNNQLAGVLFGSNSKETLGTTCFKVSLFLGSIDGEIK